MNVEAVNTIIKAVVSIIAVVITSVVIPYLKEKMGHDKWYQIQQFTEYAVRCAEQIYHGYQQGGETNKLKKQYVENYIIKKADEIGIELTAQDIDLLIEGVVNAVKYGGE